MHLSTLRKANLIRCPRFRNNRGEVCHPNGVFDWTIDQWFKALVGELGEFANWSKKYDRGDMTQEEFLAEASKELADAQCYLDLLAARLGIDLGEATRLKFNEVSERIGVRMTIHPNGNITDFGDEPMVHYQRVGESYFACGVFCDSLEHKFTYRREDATCPGCRKDAGL